MQNTLHYFCVDIPKRHLKMNERVSFTHVHYDSVNFLHMNGTTINSNISVFGIEVKHIVTNQIRTQYQLNGIGSVCYKLK